MKLFMRGIAAAVLAVSALAFTPQQAAATPVDVQLSLLVDVSGSVSLAEFNIQRQGYADAFRSAPYRT